MVFSFFLLQFLSCMSSGTPYRCYHSIVGIYVHSCGLTDETLTSSPLVISFDATNIQRIFQCIYNPFPCNMPFRNPIKRML